jgi:homogentisate 1,2-dioxygenase
LHPVAKYEIEKEHWEIVYKLGGKFFKSTQQHSPFDVVAWHGNYVPYKYDLTKFVNVGSISVDHIDPSIFCVLTAPSRDPAAPLADFLIFSPRWDVASHTYRPPYYHRNAASELMGLIYGEYAGRSDEFQPGGVSFECGFVPHGVAYEEFKAASAEPPPEMRISKDAVAFMMESSRPFTITDWAWTSNKKHEHEPKMWYV